MQRTHPADKSWLSSVMAEAETEFPKALVKKIVKAKLAEIAAANEDGRKEYQINKDALLAFSESARVFVSYVTAAANDICKDNARQIITGEDFIQALEELEFKELAVPLRESLEGLKASSKEKSKKRPDSTKKRKETGAKDADAAAGAFDDEGDELAAAGSEDVMGSPYKHRRVDSDG